MKKMRYMVYETFVSQNKATQQARLQQLAAEYLRAIQQQILQNGISG